MNTRESNGEWLALAVVTAIAALGATKGAKLPRRSGGRNISIASKITPVEPPSAIHLIEMIAAEYSPSHIAQVYPDHAAMIGRNVKVVTKDRGLVTIRPEGRTL